METKTYLSFDIGIKNLAYIIFEDGGEGNRRIIEWDIINIMEDDINAQRKCDLEKCKKFAEHYSKKNCDTFLCKNHYKKYIKDGGKKLNRLKIINCNQVNTFDVMNKMYDLLDERYSHFFEVDAVLLEMQPLKRQQMRSIANLLYAYFNIKGIRSNESNIKDVNFVSATNKLKYKSDENGNKSKNTYAERKKLAIEFCFDYLKEIQDDNHHEKFNSSKKKDDLADALLQCLFHIT